jgi:hypothetical protein
MNWFKEIAFRRLPIACPLLRVNTTQNIMGSELGLLIDTTKSFVGEALGSKNGW